MAYEELLTEIESILAKNQEAARFVVAYGEYIEMIDDCVDEPKDVELLNKMTATAQLLFSSNYWRRNADYLGLIEQTIHTVYFNVVEWEQSDEAWKRRDAKALSHVGYFMLFAILLLETRDPKLVQRLSLKFMERAHLMHIQDLSQEEKAA